MNVHYSNHRHHVLGFSIIELMVAVAVGMLVIAGIIGLFATNKRVYTNTQNTTELQENGRFALQYLLKDLRHAYFFGETFYSDLDTIACTPKNDDFTDSDRPNCNGADAVFNFNQDSNPPSAPLRGVARPVSSGSGSVTADALGCIDNALALPGIPSDILVIKSATPTPISSINDLDLGSAYIASNSAKGSLCWLTADTPMIEIGTCTGYNCVSEGTYWPYYFAAYYIRSPDHDDDPPVLARKLYEWDAAKGMGLVTQDLVTGVEAMRILYGVSSSNDALPTFGAADTVTDWEDVKALKIYLLLRTTQSDFSYTDDKTYTMGDIDVTATQGSHFHRAVLSTTVMLHNKQIIDAARESDQ